MKATFRHALLLGITLLLTGGVRTTLYAQQELWGYRQATANLTVGPELEGGASLIVQPPDGTKVGPVFAYRIGASMYYPLIPVITAGMGLSIDSRGTKLRGLNSSDVYDITRVTYLSIYPNFGLAAFSIGLNLGIPLGGSHTLKSGAGTNETSESMTDAQFDKVEFLLEPRIGVTIPIVDGQDGWLALTIMGGFSLNELATNDAAQVVSSDIAGDFRMATAHIGFTYQFVIPGTSVR